MATEEARLVPRGCEEAGSVSGESLRWVVVGNKTWVGSLNGKQRSEHLGWELTFQPLSEAERHPGDGRYVVWW